MERDIFISALQATARVACCATLVGGLFSCEDTKDEEQEEAVDLDGDGVTEADGDCNDSDAAISPQAQEICNGIDDNCDDLVDNDPQDGLLWYTDADGDGQGAGDGEMLCEQTENTSSSSGDCDDSDASLNLNDSDGDGYTSCDGDCDDSDASLNLNDEDLDGYSSCDGDCDDSYEQDMVDYDEDGFTMCDGDCNDWDPEVIPVDGDGDGYNPCEGDCDDTDPEKNPSDTDEDGYSSCEGDCDDTDASVLPDGECLSDCEGAIDTFFDPNTESAGEEILDCCVLVVNQYGWDGSQTYEHWDACCDVIVADENFETACTPWGPPVPPKMKEIALA